ncbi:MAG TPA: hypothetical protein CFH82_03395 [Sulfurospirillum sp. UBA12182]|nr:MAG TPA: hypothetical protein CFH82_03395 [Sulfurospirillum sp. UBA12182]
MAKKILLWLIIAIVTFYLAQAIYIKLNSSAKAKRLPCHKEVVVFEKLYEKGLLHKIQEALSRGDLTLEVKAQKALYMDSTLFTHITTEEIEDLIKKSLKKYEKSLHVKDKKLFLDVIVYENDKLDPGKKTPESKLYRGYLVFNFLYEQNLIYKVQIDFMDEYAKDIEKRVDCALHSLMSYKGE